MLALMLSRRTIPHPPRVRRSGPCTCLSLECADFSGWRSTSSVCESSTSSVCYLKLGSAQCSGNCADVAADDDDADVVLRAGVGSSSIFRIPCPKCDHGSFSPLAITDRSIAHPSLLLRSGIALACAPPLAISDRPSPLWFHHLPQHISSSPGFGKIADSLTLLPIAPLEVPTPSKTIK